MASKKKRSVGRPQLDDSERRTERLFIRVTENEKTESKAIAKSEGYTFSGWVKMLIRKEVKRINRRKNRE